MKNPTIFWLPAVFLFWVIFGKTWAEPASSPEKISLTLESCLLQALHSNPRLLAKTDERRASELRADLAGSARFPRVQAKETFTRMREPSSFALPGSPTPLAIGDEKIQIKTVSVSQPLYTGGKIENGIRAAKSEVKMRRFGESQQAEDLVRQVTEAYVGLMKARAFQQVASQALFDTQGHARQVENLLQFGTAVRNDLLKIQVSVSERRENLIQANNAVKLACMVLANLVGEEISREAVPAAFAFVTPVPGNEEMAVQVAQKCHPILAALRESSRLHLFAARAARGDLEPTVGMQWNMNSGSQFNESQSNWDATLCVSFNVFDAGETRAKIREARVGYQKANHDLESVQRDILLGIQQAFLRMEEASARLHVAEEAETQAKESMRLTEEGFKAGAATSQNLLDDESALVAAEQRRITASFDRLLAETHLWFSIGCLEKALIPGPTPPGNPVAPSQPSSQTTTSSNPGDNQ